MSPFAARCLYWAPRILGIAFAAFLSIFALEVFGEVHGIWPTLFALCLHLIPAAIVAGMLVVAWRWEWMGAGLFALAAALYAWSMLPRHAFAAWVIGAPMLAIAVLFLANWIGREKLRLAH